MKRVLITDVDNTLLDWQELWFQTFSAMSEKVLEISGVDRELYYSECKSIHQKYQTSEYSFLLEELPCLKNIYGIDVLNYLQPAIDEYRLNRKKYLILYDGVFDTISYLRQNGVKIVAYTESKAFYTNYRFRKLKLDTLFDYLYSPKDHEIPQNLHELRKYDDVDYELSTTVHRYTPEGESKPNPHILATIIDEMGFNPVDAVYVGDSLLRDVFMAQKAGVLDVHAAYGAAQHRSEQYDLLKKVTHWTPEMIEKEAAFLQPDKVFPTIVLRDGFSQIRKVMGL